MESYEHHEEIADESERTSLFIPRDFYMLVFFTVVVIVSILADYVARQL